MHQPGTSLKRSFIVNMSLLSRMIFAPVSVHQDQGYFECNGSPQKCFKWCKEAACLNADAYIGRLLIPAGVKVATYDNWDCSGSPRNGAIVGPKNADVCAFAWKARTRTRFRRGTNCAS